MKLVMAKKVQLERIKKLSRYTKEISMKLPFEQNGNPLYENLYAFFALRMSSMVSRRLNGAQVQRRCGSKLNLDCSARPSTRIIDRATPHSSI
jgi:hypothetical protein